MPLRHFPDGILKGLALEREFEGSALKVFALYLPCFSDRAGANMR
jgi:hypothetical protein